MYAPQGIIASPDEVTYHKVKFCFEIDNEPQKLKFTLRSLPNYKLR